MNSRVLSLVACLAVFLAGCVGSDEPVIPVSEAIFDLRLLGTWADDDGSVEWVISRVDENGNAYLIEQLSGRESSLFQGYLGRLGGHLVLEVSPHFSGEASAPGRYRLSVLQFGPMAEPDIGPDQVFVSMLSPEALTEALESGELRLAHRWIDRYLLLLEDATPELRLQLGAYLQRPGVLAAFDDPFQRVLDASLTGPRYEVDAPCLQAAPWLEADQLFRRDPRWLGADAASSLDLEDGRILWVFDNTRFDAAARSGRWGDVTRIGTTVALQHGTDPVACSITFYWGVTADGEPTTFFPWRDDESLRFGGGVRLDDRLVLFFARRPRHFITGEYLGWTAIMVENLDDEPHDWHLRPIGAPDSPMGILLGNEGVLRLGGYMYAFGSQRKLKSRPVFVARWPEDRVREGDLEHPEWWAGEERGWVADSSNAAREPLFENGRHDLSIRLDRAAGRYLAVRSGGSGAALAVRTANSPIGPWSEPAPVDPPQAKARPDMPILSARAHPGLAWDSDVVLTVHMNFAYPWEPPQAVHFPRFLRLNPCSIEPLQARLKTARHTPLAGLTAEEKLP